MTASDPKRTLVASAGNDPCKPALLDLGTGGEHGLAVRGLASYRPLAYRDGVVWFAGKGSWANWASLTLNADTPGELVACRMA